MKLKKVILIGACFFLLNGNVVHAGEKINVSLNKCVDGDTAWFTAKEETIKARFLAVNTPESTTKKEEYGKEASNFTCDALTNAKKIVLEYDDASEKIDKYDRHLVWVWVDDELLQEKLLENGLAEVKYLYGKYDYTEDLKKVEAKAKENKLNMWSEKTTTVSADVENEELTFEDYFYFILALVAIILMLMNKKGRKKLNNEIKKAIKKKLS